MKKGFIFDLHNFLLNNEKISADEMEELIQEILTFFEDNNWVEE